MKSIFKYLLKLYGSVSIYGTIHASIYLFVCLFIYLCIYLFTYLFICLFTYLFICLFICLFIYLFIYCLKPIGVDKITVFDRLFSAIFQSDSVPF